jgi:hypothetical protein
MSDKIQLIIWSRDRACQTETLLDSIQRFAPNIFDVELIWGNSTSSYLEGYDKLFRDIDYLKGSFKSDGLGKKKLLDALNNHPSKIMCFTTEDTILHSKIPYSPQEFMADCDIFSLRLGKNTVVQNYATGELQPALTNYDFEFYGPDMNELTAVVYNWNFQQYPALCNYGYSFGLDMVCYNKQMIVPIIEKCSFDKPNELESQLIRFRNSVNPRMKSFEYSKAVNIPITNMSTITASAGVSIAELNTQFLAGKKLRYKLDEVQIVGCHQILEYEFI